MKLEKKFKEGRMQYKSNQSDNFFQGLSSPHNQQVANKNGGSLASLQKQDMGTFTYNLKFYIYAEVWDWIIEILFMIVNDVLMLIHI